MVFNYRDLGKIQTCNLHSRNVVHYSVMLRGHLQSVKVEILVGLRIKKLDFIFGGNNLLLWFFRKDSSDDWT